MSNYALRTALARGQTSFVPTGSYATADEARLRTLPGQNPSGYLMQGQNPSGYMPETYRMQGQRAAGAVFAQQAYGPSQAQADLRVLTAGPQSPYAPQGGSYAGAFTNPNAAGALYAQQGYGASQAQSYYRSITPDGPQHPSFNAPSRGSFASQFPRQVRASGQVAPAAPAPVTPGATPATPATSATEQAALNDLGQLINMGGGALTTAISTGSAEKIAGWANATAVQIATLHAQAAETADPILRQQIADQQAQAQQLLAALQQRQTEAAPSSFHIGPKTIIGGLVVVALGIGAAVYFSDSKRNNPVLGPHKVYITQRKLDAKRRKQAKARALARSRA